MAQRKLGGLKYIDDERKRNVAYCKRRHGLIKKVLELGVMCNQNIYVGIFDAVQQKLVEISTNPGQFTGHTVYALKQKKFSQNLIIEQFSLDDYENLEAAENISTKKITNKYIRPNYDWIAKANKYIADLFDVNQLQDKSLCRRPVQQPTYQQGERSKQVESMAQWSSAVGSRNKFFWDNVKYPVGESKIDKDDHTLTEESFYPMALKKLEKSI